MFAGHTVQSRTESTSLKFPNRQIATESIKTEYLESRFKSGPAKKQLSLQQLPHCLAEARSTILVELTEELAKLTQR